MQLYVAYAWYAEDQSESGHGYCILGNCPLPMTQEDIKVLIEKIAQQDELNPGIVVPLFWTQLPGRRN